ncbi:TonB-dependent receptor [Siphonobacter sp. SORGH_AS_1065]|uniref:TonB-dependent receptor n=1 Tax=Siphonobacter sp. SORGH_AS_1065 TaxID=3041795 RepID=UPI002786507E|nr:TonB-dependent receptor [Siphonobacter sp. SORGH_AS_1065]MDQ1087163.1 iron complex outermembrane receptor protein [Siphonobacter sp. SORGH_AS_1065]
MGRLIYFLGLFLLNVSLVLAQRGATIRGRVEEENGQPITDVTIELKPVHRSTTSNEQGRFTFTNIPAGSYELHASSLNYQFDHKLVAVADGQTVTVVLTATTKTLQLSPVTITAEKYANTQQRTALSVSSLSSRQIQERRIQEMGDMLMSVPNLMSMNVGSPTLTMTSIRGINTFSQNPVVGIYVDGIPMFDGYSSSVQIQNIERVEVLRGPQSTLYGRNALGGVINIITSKPGNVTHGFGELTLGNFSRQRYAAGLSGPLVKNKLFAGFSGIYDTRNGFFTNLYTGRKFDKPETYSGSLNLRYLASDRLSFTLHSRGEYNHIAGTFPYTFASMAEQQPLTINQNGTNRETRKLVTTSLQAVYQLKGMELSSLTGHTFMSDTYQDYDVDYSPADFMLYEMPFQPQNTLTQEFKLVSNQHEKLRFTAGLFGFMDRKKAETVYRYGADAATYYPGAPYSSFIYSDKKIQGLAAYVHATYALTSKLDLIAGLRYDYENRTLTHRTEMAKPGETPTVIAPDKTIDGHNDAVSPKLGFSLKATSDLMAYATYSRGYRSGGFNQYTAQANKLNYKPEFTDNFEVGVKSEWLNRRLRANLALFYVAWKDQQQSVAFPDLITDNVGKLQNKGLELELTALPLKGLEVNYNLGMVDTKYQSLILSDGAGKNKDYAGNHQIFTPKLSTSLAATYRHTLGQKAALFVTPEWKYLGLQYMNYYNDLIQQPFSLINLNAGVKYGPVEISIWGKNMGDVRYLTFAYATTVKAQSPVAQGAPRTIGVTLKAGF